MSMARTTRPELAFWAIGLACAGYLLFLAAQAQVYHHRAADLTGTEGVVEHRASGSLIGRLDIPALHLSVAVLEDDQSKSLLRGLGHIPGTAELGGLGTVGLAGHRDTFLKSLSGIAPGMDIRATGGSGEYHYVVDSTEIVLPQAVEVLAIRSRPELTLITCYPFHYVGAAPKRFVVHAHLVSVSPETASSAP
jgi:LPXTG-site transpeptidase (sortase) family protein